MTCLLAAETSNNSASFSSLLPLLILGIPITSSEFILYEHLMSYPVAIDFDYILKNKQILLSSYLAINVVCLFVSWPMANLCLKLYQLPKKIIIGFIALLIMFPIFYIGITQNRLVFYLGVFFVCSFFGILLKEKDTLPLIFAFMLTNTFIGNYIRVYLIFFN